MEGGGSLPWSGGVSPEATLRGGDKLDRTMACGAIEFSKILLRIGV